MAEGQENPAVALRSLLKGHANTGSRLQEDRLRELLGAVSSEEKLEILSQYLPPDGLTVLQIAASFGEANTVSLILDSISEQNDRISLITARKENGLNTIFCAATTSRPDTLGILLSYIPEERRSEETAKTEGDINVYTVMRQVVEEDKSDTLQFLLETLSDRLDDILYHRYGSAKNNLLEVAAKKNDSSIACNLLQSYQEDQKLEALTRLDNSGNAAIHWLAEKSQSGFRRQSLAPVTGSDIATVKNVNQQTALHLAAAKNHHKFLLELLDEVPKDQQYDLQRNKDEQGRTLVHHGAGELKELETVVSLVPEEKRFDLLSETDNDGQTALHEAAKRNHVDHLRFILDGHTLDQKLSLIESMNNSNETAEDVAEINGCIEAREFLRRHKEETITAKLQQNQNDETNPEPNSNPEVAPPTDLADLTRRVEVLEQEAKISHTELEQKARNLKIEIKALEKGNADFHKELNDLNPKISRLIIDKGIIEKDIDDITNRQNKEEADLLVVQQEQENVRKKLSEVESQLENLPPLPNTQTSADYRKLSLEKEELTRQEREKKLKEQEMKEQILLNEETLATYKINFEQCEEALKNLENQVKDLNDTLTKNEERLWERKAEQKEVLKKQGNDVETVEEELQNILSDYVKRRGITGVTFEKVKEVAHPINPRKKYEIILRAPHFKGNTVLHFAANLGHKELIAHLLNGLDPDHIHSLISTRNKDDQTLFHCAAKSAAKSVDNGVLEQLLEMTEQQKRCEILRSSSSKTRSVMLAYITKYNTNLNTVKKIHPFLNKNDWVDLLADSTADDSTVLHLAAAYGHKDLVQFILSSTELDELIRLLKKADKSGLLPVFRSRDASTTKEMLKFFSKEQIMEIVSNSNSSGDPAFHCWLKIDCFDQPNPEILQAFGEILNPAHWIVLNTIRNSNGYTALHWAAVRGHSEIAKVIVEKTDAKERLRLLRQMDNSGYTALVKAVIVKNDFVTFAILNNLDAHQRLELLLSSYHHKQTIVHRLVQEQRPTTTLNSIFRLLDPADILELLSQQEADKFTPIHLAAAVGYMEMVKFLSDSLQVNSIKTFDVLKCVDGSNETIIHCLARRGETDIRDLLLKKLSWIHRYQLLSIRNDNGDTTDMLVKDNPASAVCTIL